MKVILYYNASEVNKINKSLNYENEFEGTLRDDTSIVNPVIIMNITDPTKFNYCYIPEFGRYYFINDIVSVKNKLWRLSLNVDVLESFKAYFINLNCIIDKQEDITKCNTSLNDGTYTTSVETFNEIVTFPNQVGINNPVYLLTVI